MHMRVSLPVVPLLIAALIAGCGGATHHRSAPAAPAAHQALPGGIVGVMFDGPVLDGGVDLAQQLDLAVASGVESLRVSVDWSLAQPYRSYAHVTAGQRASFMDIGGAPTRLAPLDRIVAAAAARGLTVLPVVEHTPSWDASV